MDVHWQYNTSLLEVIFESQKVGNNQEIEELAVKSPKEIPSPTVILVTIDRS